MFHNFLLGLAMAALLGVVFEEKIALSKAKITLFCGCLSWVLLFIAAAGQSSAPMIAVEFGDNIAEIANLWLFLIAAMTFVAYLNKKGLIEIIIRIALPARIRERTLMFLTGFFCFIFSSLADNITATLVSVALILSLNLSAESRLKFAVMVVFGVNSGGVSLITGDVTTLMIFLAGKVTILDLLLLAGPGLISVLILAALLSWGLHEEVAIEKRAPSGGIGGAAERRETNVRKVDIVIAVLFLMTIVLTMIANIAFRIPPVLCFLTGLSVMFLVATFFKEDIDEDPIMEYIRLVEFETLFFFLGVLLIVGMLQQIGALAVLAELFSRVAPSIGNYIAGLFSALIDNVPLTAALLKAEPTMANHEWLSLTYAVGVGGSLLVIGSASGIVTMSKIPGLTVASYARYTPQVLVAYTVGYLGVLALSHGLT